MSDGPCFHPCVGLSVCLRVYVSAISPVSADGFLPNFSLVHLGTETN